MMEQHTNTLKEAVVVSAVNTVCSDIEHLVQDLMNSVSVSTIMIVDNIWIHHVTSMRIKL